MTNNSRRAYSLSVMSRFMSSSELQRFEEKYSANVVGLRGKQAIPANEKDFRVLAQYKSGVTGLKELARANNMTKSQVYQSLHRAALAKATQ